MEESSVCVYTDVVKRAISEIPEDLLYLSEEALRNKLNPSIKYYEVKRSFWEEYTLAHDRGVNMRNWRIYDGKYSKTFFYKIFLKNKTLLAWIISPMVQYEDRVSAALDRSLERYDELINMDITSTKKIKDPSAETGYRIVTETDPKKALVLLQVIKNLEDRVKGTAVQRQVSVTTSEPSGQGIKSATINKEAIDKRLQELETKLNPYRKVEYDGPESSTDDEVRMAKETSEDIEAESRRVKRAD
jgi:hypothetical protein